MRFELVDWVLVGYEKKRVHELKTRGQRPRFLLDSKGALGCPEGLVAGGKARTCDLFDGGTLLLFSVEQSLESQKRFFQKNWKVYPLSTVEVHV